MRSAFYGTVSPELGNIRRITFCEGTQLRMRRIVMRSRARATGKYPSWKVGRMVQWESINELNAFRLLDAMPEVSTFSEQPCEICYVQNEKDRYHYPDIFVVINGVPELWEVKPEADARSEETQLRTELLTRELIPYGLIYRIAIAESLAQQPRLNNSIKLLQFGRRVATEMEREFIRQILVRCGSLNWGLACSGKYGLYGREIVCRLTLEGMLTMDHTKPLSSSTNFLTINR